MLKEKMAAITLAFSTLLCANVFAQSIGQDDDEFCYTVTPLTIGRNYMYQHFPSEGVKWVQEPNEPVIKIGVFFLNGDATQRNEVKKYAREWITKSGAAIEWVFDTIDTDIRISFQKGGSWSEVGREARDVKPKTKATMYLGIEGMKGEENEERRRRIILHEFGHALGLAHEHQHPGAKIAFKPDKIFEDLKDTVWCKKDYKADGDYIGESNCKSDIRRYITSPIATSHACEGSPGYDEHSVMMYNFRPGWTAKNPDSWILAASTLSPKDIKCIRDAYPKLNSEPHPPSARRHSYCMVMTRRGRLNIRQEASEDSREVGKLPRGMNIHVTSTTQRDRWVHVEHKCLSSGDWVRVRPPGYVARRLLRCPFVVQACGTPY